jgi:ABC-type Co2+ transport system permease subunit
MNLPDGLLDGGWTAWPGCLFAAVAALLLAGAVAPAGQQQPPERLPGDDRRADLALAPAGRGQTRPFAAPARGDGVYPVFGWALAGIGLCLVLVGVSLNGAAGWQAFAVNALLMAGVGVAVSHALHRLVDRLLPRHMFVYIFRKGFFAAALAVIAVGVASCLLLRWQEPTAAST